MKKLNTPESQASKKGEDYANINRSTLRSLYQTLVLLHKLSADPLDKQQDFYKALKGKIGELQNADHYLIKVLECPIKGVELQSTNRSNADSP